MDGGDGSRGGSQAGFASVGPKVGEEQIHTDGRKPGDWTSRYSPEARREINFEAAILALVCCATLLFAGVSLGVVNDAEQIYAIGSLRVQISFHLLAIFFTGCVGGVTFSIKWLIHSVAKSKWHLDRRYWRLLTPAIGGVYACVVMTLFDSGIFATHSADANAPSLAATAALAFLVGYFSDGVSGLLSNVANAVFGTLEKK